MTIFRTIEYFNQKKEDTEKWSYVFLHSTSRPFPEEEIDLLMWNAVDMAYLGENSRNVKSYGYHAQLTRDKPAFLGGFYGVSLYAKLDMGSDKTGDMEVILLKR